MANTQGKNSPGTLYQDNYKQILKIRNMFKFILTKKFSLFKYNANNPPAKLGHH